MKIVIFLLIMVTVTVLEETGASQDSIRLTENGYTGIVVSINPAVPKSAELVEKIKVRYFITMSQAKCCFVIEVKCWHFVRISYRFAHY